MKKVTLYQWTDLQVEGNEGFSLEYCGRYGFVDCDEGRKYILPDGWALAESNMGTMEFYDPDGQCADLIGRKKPHLRSRGQTVELKLAE